MSIHVIGIGTTHGDDAAGLAVAERLRQRPLPGAVRVFACPRPDAQLLDQMDGARAVVLVDAIRSGREAGSVLRVQPDALAAEAAPASSHGLGVGHLLRLAEILGRRPETLECVAIEAGSAGPGEASEPVRRAIGVASDRVAELVVRLAASMDASPLQEPTCTNRDSASR